MRHLSYTFLTVLMLLTIQPTLAQDIAFLPPPPANIEIITPDNAHRLELLSTLGRGVIRSMDWSPDETLFAVKTSIGIWLYDDLSQLPFLSEGDSDTAAFDAEWNTLAIRNEGQVDIWDLQRREKQIVKLGENPYLEQYPLFFSVDGLWLYILVSEDHDHELWRWDVSQRNIRDSLLIDTHYIGSMNLSPRGDALILEQVGESFLVLLGETLEGMSLYRLNGAQPQAFVFHPADPVIAFLVRRNGEALVHRFNYHTQEEIGVYKVPHEVAFLAFSPDGDYLLARASHDYRGTIYRWNLETDVLKTGSSELDIPSISSVEPLTTFSPDGRYFIVRANYGIEIWDMETLQTLEPVWAGLSIRFDHQRSRVAAELPGKVSLFSLDDESLIREYPGAHSPVFSPDGKRLATIESSEHSILIYSTVSEAEPIQLTGYGSFGTKGFTPGGELLVTNGRELAVWDAAFSEYSAFEVSGFGIEALSQPDSSLRFSTFDFDRGILRQWWLDEMDSIPALRETELFDLSAELSNDSPDRLTRYALDMDNGLFIASGGEDTEYYGGTPYLYVRDLVSGRYHFVYGHSGQINSLVFSPDKKTLATGSGYITEYYASADSSLRLWDVSQVDGLWQVTERARFYYERSVNDIVFDPSGRLVAFTAWYEMAVRDTVTGREVFQHDTYRPDSLAFSPDSRLLVAKHNGRLEIWELATRESLISLPTSLEWRGDLYFDPAGRWLAVAANTGVVRLYGIVEKD